MSDLRDVAFPICPLNCFFEGDEWKCDRDQCDYDPEWRECTQACLRPELERKILRVTE